MSKEVIRGSQFCPVKSKAITQDLDLELSDLQLQELSDLYEGAFDTFRPGKIIKGVIIRSDSDGVLVDIDFKSRGLIPRYEFNEHEIKDMVAGKQIEVLIDTLENNEGNVVLSYEKAKAMRAWDSVVKLFESGEPVEGIVTHKVKGGLNVDIGIPAFLPGSQIDLQRVTDFDQYVGKTIKATILKLNKKRGNVIVSRRKFMGDQRSEVRKEILDTLKEGEVIQGTVKNITNYGVFIDIGGVDGLLHITDMTWGRIAHPSEMVRIGDTISVKILSFDKEHEKISLGLKQLDENPWENIDKKLKVGDKITGKISSITDYGLFVEVADTIEGLVHISEISWTDRISNLANRYKVNEPIEVLVVSLDKENRRMSLSIKQLNENPWLSVDKDFKPSDRIKGKISNITDFGIFVQLLPGIDGLVHISDLSWTEHVDHPRDRYTIGDEVEAVILTIDKDNKKISLGIKQLSQDPWERVEEDYPAGTIVDGEISKITNFGAFVRMPTGIEGLIHNSILAAEKDGKKAEEVFKVMDKQQFRVISVNKKDRKIALSTLLEAPAIKPAAAPVAKEQVQQEQAPRPAVAKEAAKPRERTSAPRPATTNQAPSAPVSSAPKMKGSLQLALEGALKNNEEDKESK